jgi:hypothetical protein
MHPSHFVMEPPPFNRVGDAGTDVQKEVYDGKRPRKDVERRAWDYNASVARHLIVRSQRRRLGGRH